MTEDRENPSWGIEIGGNPFSRITVAREVPHVLAVYFHPIRRIYDEHLKDFLRAWLGGPFPVDAEHHLRMTDYRVMVALFDAAHDTSAPGHDPAARIVFRDHFRLIYERTPADAMLNPRSVVSVFGPPVRVRCREREEG